MKNIVFAAVMVLCLSFVTPAAAQVTGPTLGNICGVKFNDLNGNGVQDANEPLLANWPINIAGSTTGSVTTDARGGYCFKGLKAGEYVISEVQQAGWTQTAPPAPGTWTVGLAAGQTLTTSKLRALARSAARSSMTQTGMACRMRPSPCFQAGRSC